jgi:hypothetical protein
MLAQIGYSQNYEPLVREKAHWVVATWTTEVLWNYVDFREYFISGDTIVNDSTYKKVYKYLLEPSDGYSNPPYIRIGDSTLFGFLREDTTLKKVYGIILSSNPEYCFHEEDILFDFSVLQNDTLALCHAFEGPIPIENIYYQSFFGYYRKIFQMGLSLYSPNRFIEGIGSTYGLFEYIGQTFKDTKGEHDELICYAMDEVSTCDIITLNNSIKVYQFKIFPNPSMGNINIQITKNDDQNLIYIISDIIGKNISKGYLVTSSLQLKFDTLKSGVYLIKIYNNNELLLTEKIIKL